LKVSNALLHFPFPMDRLQDVSFGIDLVMALKVLGVINITFLENRLFWWDVIEKELSPVRTWTVDLSE